MNVEANMKPMPRYLSSGKFRMIALIDGKFHHVDALDNPWADGAGRAFRIGMFLSHLPKQSNPP